MTTCRTCNGTGWIWVTNLTDPDTNERDICLNCGGEGTTA